MRVTTIDHYLPAGGTLLRWRVDASTSTAIVSCVPPSFNQLFHLGGATESGASTWLAASFDIDGPVDPKALERAYALLIARHGTLHSGFTRDRGEIVRTLYDPATMTLEATEPVAAHDSRDMQRHLWESLNDSCPTLGPPSYLLAAIDREDRSSIICGFDHAHVDAYSMAIVVDDLRALYAGCVDEPGGFSPHRLPRAGNFVDYCAAEALDERDFTRHPAMTTWTEFFRRRANTPPSFPLDLGVPPGTRAPAAVDLRELLDPSGLDAFESLCRAHGSSVFAGVLSAMGHAAHGLGAEREMPVLFPVHTRRSQSWRTAMGWFTTNAPVTVTVGDDFAATLASTGPALRSAVALAEVPVPHVLRAIGGLNCVRSDLFMVSYLDYRGLPGAAGHDAINASHISNVSCADDAQFWVSRTDRGLDLRTRHPDTPRARAQMTAFLAELQYVIACGLQSATVSAGPDRAAASALGGR